MVHSVRRLQGFVRSAFLVYAVIIPLNFLSEILKKAELFLLDRRA